MSWSASAPADALTFPFCTSAAVFPGAPAAPGISGISGIFGIHDISGSPAAPGTAAVSRSSRTGSLSGSLPGSCPAPPGSSIFQRMDTRNKSSSTSSFMVPPWTSTKLLAMASPSPEPSVLRDVSPRTNRSVSSSGDTSSSLAEILRMVISTWPSSSLTTWI